LLKDLEIYKKMIKYLDYLHKYGLKWHLYSLIRFERLISFNIKNLKLYMEQDSFNKFKGVIYGMVISSGHNSASVLFKSIKIFKIN